MRAATASRRSIWRSRTEPGTGIRARGTTWNRCATSFIRRCGTTENFFASGLCARCHLHGTIRVDACADCPWGSLQAEVASQVNTAQALLGPWQRSARLALSAPAPTSVWRERPVYNAGSPPVSRRTLFRRGTEEAEVEAVADGHHPYRERMRTLRGWRQLGSYESTEGERRLPAAAHFATLSVSEACDACATCTRACPSEALTLEKDEEGAYFWLTFAPAACLGCDLCARLCPQQAVAVGSAPTFNTVLAGAATTVQREGPLKQCARCGIDFAAADPEATHCTLCAFRRQNPFGRRIPPYLAARATGDSEEAQR